MILGLQIGLLVLGLYGLVSGKLTLSSTRVLRGATARLVAVIALLPLPLSFLVGFAVGVTAAARGRPLNAESLRLPLALVEAGITLGCLALLYAVGWPLAGRPADEGEEGPPPRRRRRAEPPPTLSEEDAPQPFPVPFRPGLQAPPAFRCLGCGSLIQVQPEFAGRKVRCGACQTVLVLPPLAGRTVPPGTGGSGGPAAPAAAAPREAAPSDAVTARPPGAGPSSSLPAGPPLFVEESSGPAQKRPWPE